VGIFLTPRRQDLRSRSPSKTLNSGIDLQTNWDWRPKQTEAFFELGTVSVNWEDPEFFNKTVTASSVLCSPTANTERQTSVSSHTQQVCLAVQPKRWLLYSYSNVAERFATFASICYSGYWAFVSTSLRYILEVVTAKFNTTQIKYNSHNDYFIQTNGTIFYFLAREPPVGQEPLIIEVSRSHSDTPHLVGLLRTGDRTDAETSTCTAHNYRKTQTSMPPAEFEPAIPASERPQTHALDRAATGIGICTVRAL
jgi:hypothetical protein